MLSLTLSGVGVTSPVLGAAKTMRGRFVHGVTIEHRDSALGVSVRLSGQPRYSTFPLYDPYRLVIDIEEDAPAAPPAIVAALSPSPSLSLIHI